MLLNLQRYKLRTTLTKIVNFSDDGVVSHQRLCRLNGSQRNAAQAMDVDILTCEIKILNFRCNRHLREHQVAAVFLEAIVGTFLVAIIITDGERRRGKDKINAVTKIWIKPFHAVKHLVSTAHKPLHDVQSGCFPMASPRYNPSPL